MSNGARGAPRRKIGAFRSTLGWVNLPCSKYFYRRRAHAKRKKQCKLHTQDCFLLLLVSSLRLFNVLNRKIN